MISTGPVSFSLKKPKGKNLERCWRFDLIPQLARGQISSGGRQILLLGLVALLRLVLLFLAALRLGLAALRLGSRLFRAAEAGAPTSDLPTKMAPGSVEMVVALTSPTISALALMSTRSIAVIFPWTLPQVDGFGLHFGLEVGVFSDRRAPSELISPSIRPSTNKSLVT